MAVALAITLPVEVGIVLKLLEAMRRIERVPQLTREQVRIELRTGAWDPELYEMGARLVQRGAGGLMLGVLRRALRRVTKEDA